MSLTRFRFHTWSRNRSHRDSCVEFFTFVDTFSQFLRYFYVVVGPASEQENLCSDRLPNSAKCVFFWFPRTKKNRNACSLLNTSYNVVTKQFFLSCEWKLVWYFWWKHEVTDSSQMKTKLSKTKITTRLVYSFEKFHGAWKYFFIM